MEEPAKCTESGGLSQPASLLQLQRVAVGPLRLRGIGVAAGSLHAAPPQPAAQTHAAPPPAAGWHTPCPEQSRGQGSARRQLAPEKPGRHSHTPPSRHTPAPEQSSGQAEKTPAVLTTPLQSCPREPAAQRHVP